MERNEPFPWYVVSRQSRMSIPGRQTYLICCMSARPKGSPTPDRALALQVLIAVVSSPRCYGASTSIGGRCVRKRVVRSLVHVQENIVGTEVISSHNCTTSRFMIATGSVCLIIGTQLRSMPEVPTPQLTQERYGVGKSARINRSIYLAGRRSEVRAIAQFFKAIEQFLCILPE